MEQISLSGLVAAFGISALGVLAIAALGLMLSAYVKIVTVLSVVRAGLGLSSLPSAFVSGTLALGLTAFVMSPTIISTAETMDRVLKSANPVSDSLKAEALDAGLLIWKKFLEQHVHPDELQTFSRIAGELDTKRAKEIGQQAFDRPLSQSDNSASQPDLNSERGNTSWRVLIPAFLVSELKEAFSTGLALLLPFLVIDLVISNLLSALSLERLNPATVSFPCKLLLFVILDGWTLITSNLVATYAG